ncbi:hypothetical protein NQZ68_034496 [Dissostichus eleginoides]|nr:hypothetical protein NQZ68_034496 [Dissostichus eleginoides]
MEEDRILQSERLLTFVRKLKEVFDVFDEDSDGFILPEHFVQLGFQFGQAEQSAEGKQRSAVKEVWGDHESGCSFVTASKRSLQQQQQVNNLAKCLDPDSHGRINFKGFCRGVLSMKGQLTVDPGQPGTGRGRDALLPLS